MPLVLAALPLPPFEGGWGDVYTKYDKR